MSEDRLAAELFSAHKRALGAADRPLSSMSPRVRRQYERFAEELRPVLDQDRDAELERLRAELAEERRRNHYERAEKLSRQLHATRAERQQAEAERDAAREQVKRVRDLVASASWEHALVKARDVRRALDGTETT